MEVKRDTILVAANGRKGKVLEIVSYKNDKGKWSTIAIIQYLDTANNLVEQQEPLKDLLKAVDDGVLTIQDNT